MMKLLFYPLFFAVFAFAAPLKHVAVFETMADAENVMDESELRYLTNELRKIALEQLPQSSYSVMTRDNIMALLPPDKDAAECFEGQCLVEVGRNVGADYAVQGTVSRYGGLLTLSVECYETMGAKLVGSFTSESEDTKGLLAAMRLKAPSMFAHVLGQDDTPILGSIIPSGITVKKALGWSAFALDALGVAGIVFGIYQNSNAVSLHKDYENLPSTDQSDINAAWKKVDDAKTKRNAGYIIGGVLLATGVTFHIVF
jgi:hypothetical protein